MKKIIEADCFTCAMGQLQKVGGLFNDANLAVGMPARYARCGDGGCPCADFHDNHCTNGVGK